MNSNNASNDGYRNNQKLCTLMDEISLLTHQVFVAHSSSTATTARSVANSQLISKLKQILEIINTHSLIYEQLAQVIQCASEVLKHSIGEVRMLTYSVLNNCIEAHFEVLHSLRDSIFDILVQNDKDMFACLQTLMLLTASGRKIDPFEAKLGPVLVQWYSTIANSRHHSSSVETAGTNQLYTFIFSVLKRCPNALDEESVTQLTKIMCARCDQAWIACDSEQCKRYLKAFSTIIKCGYPRALCEPSCLRTLCCMVNEDGHGTWFIMKKLLKSPCQYQVLRGLLSLLDERPEENQSEWVLRGAVFFVGMSCWGSQRIESLQFSWGNILPHLLGVLQCDHAVVVFEVILAMQRLIKKYGDVMRVEWDVVLEILAQLRPWLNDRDGVRESSLQSGGESAAGGGEIIRSTNLNTVTKEALLEEEGGASVSSMSDSSKLKIHETRIPGELLDTLTLIEDLYRSGEFHGDREHFFALLDMYLDRLSDSSTFLLLQIRSEEAYPAYNSQWLQCLKSLMEQFYVSKRSAAVREKVLTIVKDTAWSCKNVCEDRVIDEIIVLYLYKAYDDSQEAVRLAGIDLILEMARNLETVKFDKLLDILVNAVSQAKYQDSQLSAIKGIVSLFSSVFDHLPYNRALRLFELVAAIVEEHRNYEVRRVALVCLTEVCSSNETFQLQWTSAVTRTSRFLFCSRCYVKPDRIAAVVPVHQAFSAFLSLASTESRAELFYMAAKGLRKMLQNSYILVDMDVDDMALKLISTLNCKAFGRAALEDELLQADSFTSQQQHHHLSSSSESCSDTSQTELTSTTVFTEGSTGGQPRRRRRSSSEPKVGTMLEDDCDHKSDIIRLQHMEIGYSLLLLHMGNAAEKLSPFVNQQILKCFLAALSTKPINVKSYAEEDKNRFVEPEGGGSLRYRSSVVGGDSAPHHQQQPQATRFLSQGFTSRVMSRLQTRSGSSKSKVERPASSKSTSDDDDDTKPAKRSEILIRSVECAYKRTLYRGILFMAMDSPERVSESLFDILKCVNEERGVGELYCHTLEFLLNLLSIRTVEFKTHDYQLLMKFVAPSLTSTLHTRVSLLGFRVITETFSHCPLQDRPALANYSINVFKKEVQDNSKLQVLVDFFTRMTYAPGDAVPHCFQPRPSASVFNEKNCLSKSWVYQSALITITTGRLGYADIIVRRPTGTTQWMMQCRNHLWAGHLHPALRHHPPFQYPDAVVETLENLAEEIPTKALVVVPAASTAESKPQPVQLPPAPPTGEQSQAADTSEKVRSDSEATLSTTAAADLRNSKITRRRLSDTSAGGGAPLLKTALLRNSPTLLRKKSNSLRRNMLPLPSYDGEGGSPSIFVKEEKVVPPLVEQEKKIPGDEKKSSSTRNSPDLPYLAEMVSVTKKATTTAGPSDSSVATTAATTFDDDDNNDSIILDPAFFLAQLHGINIGLDNNSGDKPEQTFSGSALSRAINVLDRTPGIRTLKIGVLYVAADQKTESDILQNVCGSPRYLGFLRNLGCMLRLKDLQGYSGGLDCQNDDDGTYCIAWRDDCIEAIFHVATLMNKTSSSSKTSCIAKKRHIGNDYVTIVFTDAIEKYKSDTIPGQVNDVHIIIEPIICNNNFRVEVRAKRDVGPFGPLYGVQIVPASVLATAVRLTAFNADLACQVFHKERVEAVPSAEERLRQIKQIQHRSRQQKNASVSSN